MSNIIDLDKYRKQKAYTDQTSNEEEGPDSLFQLIVSTATSDPEQQELLFSDLSDYLMLLADKNSTAFNPDVISEFMTERMIQEHPGIDTVEISEEASGRFSGFIILAGMIHEFFSYAEDSERYYYGPPVPKKLKDLIRRAVKLESEGAPHDAHEHVAEELQSLQSEYDEFGEGAFHFYLKELHNAQQHFEHLHREKRPRKRSPEYEGWHQELLLKRFTYLMSRLTTGFFLFQMYGEFEDLEEDEFELDDEDFFDDEDFLDDEDFFDDEDLELEEEFEEDNGIRDITPYLPISDDELPF